MADSAFGDFGRLLFPADRSVPENATLSEVSSENVYVWYSGIQPKKTVEIVNFLKTRAESGEQIFSRFIRTKKYRQMHRKQIPDCFTLAAGRAIRLPL